MKAVSFDLYMIQQNLFLNMPDKMWLTNAAVRDWPSGMDGRGGSVPGFHCYRDIDGSVTSALTDDLSEGVIASTLQRRPCIPESAESIQCVDGIGGEGKSADSVRAELFGSHLSHCRTQRDEGGSSDACEGAARLAHSLSHENSIPSHASENDDMTVRASTVPLSNSCRSGTMSGDSLRRHGGTPRSCTPGATLEFVNLVSVDSERTQAGICLLHELWAAPLTLALNLFLVYHQIPRAFKYALGFTGLFQHTLWKIAWDLVYFCISQHFRPLVPRVGSCALIDACYIACDPHVFRSVPASAAQAWSVNATAYP